MKPPLAERLRPQSLDDLIGQEHLAGEGSILRQAIDQGRIPSMILWGPPGTGKTTIANIIAHTLKVPFYTLSAISAGVKEVRQVIDEAKRTDNAILFIDEIHRFNKGQQDALLGAVEKGIITLIGATTENPSFEVNSALLSRCQVYVLKPLSEKDLEKLLRVAIERDDVLNALSIDLKETAAFIKISGGDARKLLNLLELVAETLHQEKVYDQSVQPQKNQDNQTIIPQENQEQTIIPQEKQEQTIIPLENENKKTIIPQENENKKTTIPQEKQIKKTITIRDEDVMKIAQQRIAIYDKSGEQHYDIISAFIKSIRGSDPNGAIYWLARMVEGGEDVKFIARRMVILASEDIGNANPTALVLANSCFEAVNKIGYPESRIILAQCATYLAASHKSNASYMAIEEALDVVRREGDLPVPLHIRNAPTSLMKKMDYGKGYQYSHSYERNFSSQEYLPEKLAGRTFYDPGKNPREEELRKYLRNLWGKKYGY